MNVKIEKFGKILCFFISLFILEWIVWGTENFFLSLMYPTIVTRNVFTYQFILKGLAWHSISTLINLVIFAGLIEFFKKKWFIIPLAMISSFLINLLISKINYAHIYFDLKAWYWIAYIFYTFALFTIAFLLFENKINKWWLFVIFYFIFIIHRIGMYLSVSLITKSFDSFLNQEFYRYLMYSVVFGILHLFFEKIIMTKKLNINSPQ